MYWTNKYSNNRILIIILFWWRIYFINLRIIKYRFIRFSIWMAKLLPWASLTFLDARGGSTFWLILILNSTSQFTIFSDYLHGVSVSVTCARRCFEFIRKSLLLLIQWLRFLSDRNGRTKVPIWRERWNVLLFSHLVFSPAAYPWNLLLLATSYRRR